MRWTRTRSSIEQKDTAKLKHTVVSLKSARVLSDQDELETALEELIESEYGGQSREAVPSPTEPEPAEPAVPNLNFCYVGVFKSSHFSSAGVRSEFHDKRGSACKVLPVSFEVRYRLPVKSPPHRLVRVASKPAAAKKTTVAKAYSGIQYLPNGEPFISMWPASRPPPKMSLYPSQSVDEAAAWAPKAGNSLSVFRWVLCSCGRIWQALSWYGSTVSLSGLPCSGGTRA